MRKRRGDRGARAAGGQGTCGTRAQLGPDPLPPEELVALGSRRGTTSARGPRHRCEPGDRPSGRGWKEFSGIPRAGAGGRRRPRSLPASRFTARSCSSEGAGGRTESRPRLAAGRTRPPWFPFREPHREISPAELTAAPSTPLPYLPAEALLFSPPTASSDDL